VQITKAIRNAIAAANSGRDAVVAVEQQVKQLPQVALPLEHGFAPGVYARKLFIPKGTVLTGKIHKYAHWNIVLQGHIEVMTERGVQHIRAPAMFVSPPGTKRAGFAHEDTVWVTMHPTNETDPETIERDVVVDTFEEYERLEGKTECPLLPQPEQP
jgi:quercetin dioxygenase-like cupin family protein